MLIATLFFGCSPKATSQAELNLVDTIKLNIDEPSGITAYKKHLYIVSDQNGNIYKTTLSGEVVEKIKTNYKDLEGITTLPSLKKIAIVNEAKRSLIYLNFKGKFLNKHKIKGKQEESNSGLEGICFDSSKKRLFAINEKEPKQLLELSLKGNIKNKYPLSFANDVSGICYDKNNDCLWIISDESKAIYRISKEGKLLKKYKTGVLKGEGIAIYKNHVYVVSDYLNTLYVFKMEN
ncbi:SdiA-regulated domain-containing protein [Lutibacter holmesii]|uniref:SdiA-regulated domain-containing protein n=1 Tax=Lutibacter holmesii TaxID=1137985 RepID=A0ABW3WUC9_9FLAO